MLEKGDLTPRDNKIRKPQKVNQKDLEVYIEKHPDATLATIAKEFNCAMSSIYYRIKKGKIKYKKSRKHFSNRSM